MFFIKSISAKWASFRLKATAQKSPSFFVHLATVSDSGCDPVSPKHNYETTVGDILLTVTDGELVGCTLKITPTDKGIGACVIAVPKTIDLSAAAGNQKEIKRVLAQFLLISS